MNKRNHKKRFFTSLSIITLLAPIFIASADVFAEDFSTSHTSEETSETISDILPQVDEVTQETVIEPIPETVNEVENLEKTEESIVPVPPASSDITNEIMSEIPPIVENTESTIIESDASTSEGFVDPSTEDFNTNEGTKPSSTTEESSESDSNKKLKSTEDHDWTGGIGLDDLEINQTIEETFTLSAADIVKNKDNDNYVLTTKDGKIGITIDTQFWFSSYTGYNSDQNFLDPNVSGEIALTNDSYGKLYSFQEHSPGLLDVYSFNSTSEQAFYLKNKDGNVDEYLITLAVSEHEPVLEPTFVMSEENSGKPVITNDGLVTITPNYESFNWQLKTTADWRLLNYDEEIYHLYKEYEQSIYHISIYSESLQQVKSYKIPVERVISEDTIVEHELDINLSQNNQYRFANEFYQEYGDILSGLSITASYRWENYYIQLESDKFGYINDLKYSNNETDAAYVSYINHHTWEDVLDENNNWVESIEKITKLKLNIKLDNTTPIDESKEKVFNFNVEHNQLIMNSKEDQPYEVTLDYGGPSNHTETFRIAYLNTTDFNDGNNYNYKGEYVEVSDYNSYVNTLSENTPGTITASSDYNNKIVFTINNRPAIPEETVNVDVSRQSDWENPIEVSPKSDNNLNITAYRDYGLSYSLHYDYDWDDIHYYESAEEWKYDVPVDSGMVEQTIYKRKGYSGNIVAIYKVQFNFTPVVYELQDPLSLSIPKKLGFNRVYQETPDGQVVLVGNSDTVYESNEFYFNAYAIATKKGIENDVQVYYEGFSTYPDSEDYERDPFLYTEGSDGIIKKYPVTIIPDTDAVAPTKKEYFNFDISATSQELAQINNEIENMLPGKQYILPFSKYENWSAGIYLDRENQYATHKESTPKNERFVIFYQGVRAFEKIGSDKYQATIDWNPYFKYNLTITDNEVIDILPTKLALSESKVKITAGETATIGATITPENATNKSITWTSEDEKIATVTNGVITGIKAGKTTITATTANGLKKSVKVTVEKEVGKPIIKEELKDESGSGISLSAPEGVLPKGAELKVEPIKGNDSVHQQLDALTEGKFVLFDIKLYNSNAGQNVQPNGTVTVRVPIPAGFDPAKIKMYHFDEYTGKRTAMKGWVEGAYYVFETDHFSYYTLVEEEPKKEEDNKLPEVDKKALQELISQATALKQADYTEATWVLFTEKLQAAQGTEANLLATDADVAIAMKELKTAMDALVKKVTGQPNTGDNNAAKPDADKEVNDKIDVNNTPKPNKPEDKPVEKADTKPKNDALLPQLGSSASIFLPILGLLFVGLSGFVLFKRNRLNTRR